MNFAMEKDYLFHLRTNKSYTVDETVHARSWVVWIGIESKGKITLLLIGNVFSTNAFIEDFASS